MGKARSSVLKEDARGGSIASDSARHLPVTSRCLRVEVARELQLSFCTRLSHKNTDPHAGRKPNENHRKMKESQWNKY
jgi:hypothetical protein